MKTASWVIRHKETKEVIFETFSERTALLINTLKFEAIPILPYLQSLNNQKK